MRLTVVGCAGGFPAPDSAASCYLLEAEGFRLVVDLGNGALGALQKYAGLFDVDAICLSHLHADHCVDLYSYSIARTYAPGGPQPPIPVYGPAGTCERIGLIHGAGGDGDGLMKRFTFETLAPGTLEIGPLRITTAHMNHPVETFGFRFSHAGRSIVYSGDSGETEELVTLASDADVFLCEAAFLDGPDLPQDLHLTAGQAAGYAARAGAGQLVLTHLQPWNQADQAYREAAAFRGDLALAHPGKVISLLAPGDRVERMSRPDGRAADALRPVRFTRGWLDHAEGSVLVEFGATRVLCAASVAEEVPRWRRGSGVGWVTAEYAMLPRATNTRGERESVKGRLGGRTQEISRLVGRALRACVDYKALGENTIIIDCDVLQADGGTRTAAVTGGYVALADAVAWLQAKGRCKGAPLVSSVSAVSVGIVDGEPRLDLCYEEDSAAETDMNVVCTGSGEFVEIQGTAEREPFSRTMLTSLLNLAEAGCGELSRLQEEALNG